MGKTKTKLKVAEMFAGIGGVTGGFLEAGGYESVFLSDLDSTARSSFVANFPGLSDRYHVKAANRLTGPAILDLAGGEIDGLLGCPPCQGLSPAGPRKITDRRNKLLFEMHRLVWSIRPKFFVIENVPSLLRSSLFQHFDESLSRFYLIHSEVVNAAEYGVPQLRRRAIVVGLHRDLGITPSLPAPTHGGCGRVFDYRTGKYLKPSTTRGRHALQLRPRVRLPKRPLVTLRKALGDLPADIQPGEEAQNYARPPQTAYQRRLRRRGEGRVLNHRAWDHEEETVERLSQVRPGECPRQYGSRSRNETYFSQAYARLHPTGLARTITTNFHNPGSGRFTHYAAPRTLTIREALRLQGFPDGFRFEDICATDAERLVGNAFPRLLAAAIARHVRRLVRA